MKKTLENLIKAFIGESQARNRYTFYAKIAQKEGFEQIGGIFLETADQEKQHAKRLFEHIQILKGKLNAVKIEAEAPLVYGKTADNLKAAIAGEHFEYSKMYPEFAEIAQQEGFEEIAKVFTSIAVAEKRHEERYNALAKNIADGLVFKRDKAVSWVCRNCGYVREGQEAPQTCPACAHPQSYYELEAANY